MTRFVFRNRRPSMLDALISWFIKVYGLPLKKVAVNDQNFMPLNSDRVLYSAGARRSSMPSCSRRAPVPALGYLPIAKHSPSAGTA